MRHRATLLTIAAFALALVLSAVIAGGAATVIEKATRQEVRVGMEAQGYGWIRVHTDGLQVILTGTAPTEAERFRAVSLADKYVDSSRVVDNTDTQIAKPVTPPDFSLEMLRNENGISLIGLVPAGVDRKKIAEELKKVAGDEGVTDMLESADYPVPGGWEEAMRFGLKTLETLPRSKVSVSPGKVKVQAITDSVTEKGRVETSLARTRPTDLRLDFDISAPRPVITPFTLRFIVDEEGARFDACSADTERARERIFSAARGAGAKGTLSCTIGMGTPSPDWSIAAAMAIKAVGQLGAATVTFSDADIALDAKPSVAQKTFDEVVGELESNLPGVFSLKAALEPSPKAKADEAQFIATRDGKGHVDLKGRVLDARQREAVESFARAKLGHDKVHGATRVDKTLPAGWPIRTLAGIEALAELHDGTVLVTPKLVKVTGVTGNPQGSDTISRILTSQLGEGAQIDLKVKYDKRLDPVLALPSGKECVTRLNGSLAKQKINFDPGSAQVSADSVKALDALAGAMKDCTGFRMEVGGYTDNQGREEMNLQLSQDRAQAVIRGLLDRGVLVGNLVAKGYGEAAPIASNDTEAGREENRRIEFTLLDKKPVDESADGSQDGEPHWDGAVTDDATPATDGAAPEGKDAAPQGDAPATDADANNSDAAPAAQEEIPVETPADDTPRPKFRPKDLTKG
ncbi:OmpA family protein [Thioclava atlantica]|uniref:OmpA/MotB domain-containing protein n=1 Tax=Thioclava atlantica TaxID=1317124 RepID=A0A085TZB9_9RHOB|nr:OmpA family protein [Thioclava atlantica]KFE36066.1 OmpA/MotB domain-containing protein [Thioclava atlantica]